MAGDPMNADAVRDKISSITLGTVMAAAARDYQNELLEQEKSAAKSRVTAWEEFDLDSLAEDPELEKLHARRVLEMQKEVEKRQRLQQKGHGEYRQITEEEFLGEVTGSDRVVVHFFHKEFLRCKIMDKHLALLVPKYFDTKFVKIDAENCPFFVAKLAIKVLPCVLLFRSGKTVDRIVGFQDLGSQDDFQTSALEARLLKNGIILPKKRNDDDEKPRASAVRSSTWDTSGSDSD